MDLSCLRQVSKGVFVCTVTSVILYESFWEHNHDHTPDPKYSPPPSQTVQIIGTTMIGSASPGTT